MTLQQSALNLLVLVVEVITPFHEEFVKAIILQQCLRSSVGFHDQPFIPMFASAFEKEHCRASDITGASDLR